MAFTLPPAKLTVSDLMTRGYFPDRVIPPVNPLSLSVALADIHSFVVPKATASVKREPSGGVARGRCVTHSIPKRKHLRRTLSIPNPLHQFILSAEIAGAWDDISQFCAQSTISLSAPRLSAIRALESSYPLNQQPEIRAQRSVGSRYVLKADIAQFYPSIYTHSIPWAFHGKTAARSDKKYALLGNRLDLWIRESQDKQTGGIPIGPDTSFVVGEILATSIDLKLLARITSLAGSRSIDDYHLYFSTLSEAEKALAMLHEVAREFELDINDPKTEVMPLPDILEPGWKSDLRTITIRDKGTGQAKDLLTLFDRAFEHSKHFASDSVLTYAAKHTLGVVIDEENWKFYEALLLRAAVAEPTLLSVVEEVYEKYAALHVDNTALSAAIDSICSYHAPLQQGNEVSWCAMARKKNECEYPESGWR